MKLVRRLTRWAAASLAAVPVVLAGLSVPTAAGTVLVVLIVVLALCWIIRDAGRSQRLAMLIRASRSSACQQRAVPCAPAVPGWPIRGRGPAGLPSVRARARSQPYREAYRRTAGTIPPAKQRHRAGHRHALHGRGGDQPARLPVPPGA